MVTSVKTGDDWAADCRVSDKNSSRYVSCQRFARGVADGFIIAQMLNEAANPPQPSLICVPKLATTESWATRSLPVNAID
jgi:hypothetical protein